MGSPNAKPHAGRRPGRAVGCSGLRLASGDLLVTASAYGASGSDVRSMVPTVRKALTVVAMLAAGAALPSCTTDQASETASAPAFERSAHIDRAPLPPPQGYAPDTTSAVPSGRYTDFSNESGAPETGGRLTWHAIPALERGERQTIACLWSKMRKAGTRLRTASPEDAGEAIQPEARDNY